MTRREVEVVPGPGESVFSSIGTGYDYDAGAGFVDAVAALAAVPQNALTVMAKKK
jgi:hypothetical protein